MSIDASSRSVCEGSGAHNHPVEHAVFDDPLLNLFVRENIPQQQWNQNVIVEKPQPPFAFADAQRRLADEPLHAKLFHCLDDAPRTVGESGVLPEEDQKGQERHAQPNQPFEWPGERYGRGKPLAEDRQNDDRSRAHSCAESRQHAVLAVDRGLNRVVIQDVALDDTQVLVCRSDLRRVARKGGYNVSLLQRLFNQRSTCSTGCTEDEQFHCRRVPREARTTICLQPPGTKRIFCNLRFSCCQPRIAPGKRPSVTITSCRFRLGPSLHWPVTDLRVVNHSNDWSGLADSAHSP